MNQVTKVIKICSGANLGKKFQLILKQIGLGHLAMWKSLWDIDFSRNVNGISWTAQYRVENVI